MKKSKIRPKKDVKWPNSQSCLVKKRIWIQVFWRKIWIVDADQHQLLWHCHQKQPHKKMPHLWSLKLVISLCDADQCRLTVSKIVSVIDFKRYKKCRISVISECFFLHINHSSCIHITHINDTHFLCFSFIPNAASFVEPNLPQTSSLVTNQRRSSVPSDNLVASNRNNCHNGKSKNRKKSLRRRSSGGAEILCSIVSETEPSSSSSSPWYRFKRNETTKNRSDLDLLLSRRRGSLPVEVLTTCHSGKCYIS